jgi:sulfotransferase family protein
VARSALVLGTGRSGTSLLAGLFHDAGYFVGDNLWPATISNPMGYFEDIEINKINEDLLDQVAPWRPRGIAGAVLPAFRDRPKWGQRWLLTLPEGTEVPSDPQLDQRIRAQTARRPYLFKDPRFSYTLAAWMPFLAPETTFLCVFREPQRTVNSIMRIVRQERYLWDIKMTQERACQYWTSIYRSVLHQRSKLGGDWFFVHYDELLTRRAIPLLECHLEARADVSMLRPELNRSTMTAAADSSSEELFRLLLELAEQKYA